MVNLHLGSFVLGEVDCFAGVFIVEIAGGDDAVVCVGSYCDVGEVAAENVVACVAAVVVNICPGGSERGTVIGIINSCAGCVCVLKPEPGYHGKDNDDDGEDGFCSGGDF